MNKFWVQMIPGTISSLRILIGFAFPWISTEWRLAAALTAGFTDLIDGPISRWIKADGRFGQLFDPIADKIFLLCVFVTLVMDESLAWWAVILVGVRDIAVFFGCAVLISAQGWNSVLHLGARFLGKVTTALQVTFLLASLWGSDQLAHVLLFPTALVGMLAFADYCIAFRASLVTGRGAGSESPPPQEPGGKLD